MVTTIKYDGVYNQLQLTSILSVITYFLADVISSVLQNIMSWVFSSSCQDFFHNNTTYFASYLCHLISFLSILSRVVVLVITKLAILWTQFCFFKSQIAGKNAWANSQAIFTQNGKFVLTMSKSSLLGLSSSIFGQIMEGFGRLWKWEWDATAFMPLIHTHINLSYYIKQCLTSSIKSILILIFRQWCLSCTGNLVADTL